MIPIDSVKLANLIGQSGKTLRGLSQDAGLRDDFFSKFLRDQKRSPFMTHRRSAQVANALGVQLHAICRDVMLPTTGR